MGRPRTNHSNWWRGESDEVEQQAMAVLTATAKATLRRMDPDKSNFVEVGDLISEGWLRSMRYARRLEKWEPLRCMKHMRTEYLRLRFRAFSSVGGQPCRIVRISDDFPLVYHGGKWGTQCLELWDLVQTRCTVRQQLIVLERWRGSGRNEAAKRIGISGESVRLEHLRIRRALKDVV